MIEQWGYFTQNVSNTTITVTNLVVFSNSYYQVLATYLGNGVHNSSATSVKVGITSNDKFNLYMNSHYDDKLTGVSYRAMGY